MQMIDEQVGVEYGEPAQPGPGFGDNGLRGRVTRQTGLPPAQLIGIDPQPPPPIIQGDHEVVAYRNSGPHVAGRFASDGTFHSDHRADDNILFVDHALSDPEAMPPGLERRSTVAPPIRSAGFGEMLAVEQREAVKAAAIAAGFIVSDAPGEVKDSPTTFDVVASDDPGESHDPRDKSSQPQVLSASALPTIKKAPIVPIVDVGVIASAQPKAAAKTVKAKAAPKVTRAKAAANKGKK